MQQVMAQLGGTVPVDSFEEAMKIDPKSSIIILGKSAQHFQNKNYAECIKECDEELAALESRRQHIEESKKAALTKLEESKGIADSAKSSAIQGFKNQVKSHLQKKDFAGALSVYQAWHQFEPSNPVVFHHMAVMHSKMSNFDFCRQQCTAGIDLCKKIDPENKEHGELLKKLEEKQEKEQQEKSEEKK